MFTATALTVDNITGALKGIGWGTIGQYIFHLPNSKHREIAQQFSSADDRVRVGAMEWLLRDPLASWRRLIHQLYAWDVAEQADSILHYTEELTGMCMIKIMIYIALHHMICIENAQGRKSLVYIQWL